MKKRYSDKYRTYVDQLVIALVGKDNLYAWWNNSNRAFDYVSPNEVWKTEPEKVIQYLRFQYSGDYL